MRMYFYLLIQLGKRHLRDAGLLPWLLQLTFGAPVARKIRCLEDSLIALPFCLVLGVVQSFTYSLPWSNHPKGRKVRFRSIGSGFKAALAWRPYPRLARNGLMR